ncbi:MAG TPA: hypothetical protein VIQ03_03135 [Gammaproteobacteria bacterium]
MDNLIDVLLQCPNLSLRLLDGDSRRTVRTINTQELQQWFNEQQSCKRDCPNTDCFHKSE